MQKLQVLLDGIMAIANAEAYNSTLKNKTNWTWRELNNFLLKENENNLVVFGDIPEDEYWFDIHINENTKLNFFREFEYKIEVTNGKLYLVTWGDLTSTLQFQNTFLPEKSNADLEINIENGFYKVVVKQLFNPEDYDFDPENNVGFVLEFHNSEPITYTVEKIIWTEDFPNDDSSFLDDTPSETDEFLKMLLERDKLREENN